MVLLLTVTNSDQNLYCRPSQGYFRNYNEENVGQILWKNFFCHNQFGFGNGLNTETALKITLYLNGEKVYFRTLKSVCYGWSWSSSHYVYICVVRGNALAWFVKLLNKKKARRQN